MVEGQLKEHTPRPLVAVDLDGTLIEANTFKIFLRCGLRCLLSKGKFFSLAYILGMLLLRKLKLISHSTLKFNVLPKLGSDEQLHSRFIKAIVLLYNPDVLELLDEYMKQGYEILLATAAADTYIEWIWAGKYQATKMQNNKEHIENRGDRKLYNILEYCKVNDCVLKVVVTDHSDDLPLLCAGALNILVKPSKRSLDIIRSQQIPIHKIIL